MAGSTCICTATLREQQAEAAKLDAAIAANLKELGYGKD
jgi:type I restriction enzyme M protein